MLGGSDQRIIRMSLASELRLEIVDDRVVVLVDLLFSWIHVLDFIFLRLLLSTLISNPAHERHHLLLGVLVHSLLVVWIRTKINDVSLQHLMDQSGYVRVS